MSFYLLLPNKHSENQATPWQCGQSSNMPQKLTDNTTYPQTSPQDLAYIGR